MTSDIRCRCHLLGNFNPHEREARDSAGLSLTSECSNFNPHEREARDKE